MVDGEEPTFSAKQVATRIGTDAKSLRKFFRDPTSGYEAVGQGARYDFPASQLPEIKEKFDAWASTKAKRNRTSARVPAPSTGGVSNVQHSPIRGRRLRAEEAGQSHTPRRPASPSPIAAQLAKLPAPRMIPTPPQLQAHIDRAVARAHADEEDLVELD